MFAGKQLIGKGVKAINISLSTKCDSWDRKRLALQYHLHDFKEAVTPLMKLASEEDTLIVPV